MDYYDEEIKQAIASLPAGDRLALIESLFNGMVNTMRAYYLHKGHSDREIQMIIQTEVNGVKKLVSERISDTPEENPNPCVEIERHFEKMDSEFVSDATIDLHFMMVEISNPE